MLTCVINPIRKRARYDNGDDLIDPSDMFGGGGFGGPGGGAVNIDPSILFNMMGQMGGMGGMGGGPRGGFSFSGAPGGSPFGGGPPPGFGGRGQSLWRCSVWRSWWKSFWQSWSWREPIWRRRGAGRREDSSSFRRDSLLDEDLCLRNEHFTEHLLIDGLVVMGTCNTQYHVGPWMVGVSCLAHILVNSRTNAHRASDIIMITLTSLS